MKTVVIASENPVKVAVAKRAFNALYPEEVFEFVAVKSESGVPDQPMNDETKQGALNRLAFVKMVYPDADFWISQEGGVYEDGERLFNRAWIAVGDAEGRVATSATAQFYLPQKITTLIKEGKELGLATDEFFKTVASGTGKGAIGHLTDGVINREEYYVPAAVIALSELKHWEWYQ